VLIPRQSWGIIALRPDLELEGFVQAENILRTPKFQGARLIMQRNTAQIEARYHFLQEGRAFGWLSTGLLEDAKLTAIGRGVYDSIYDIGEHFSERFTVQEKEKRKFEYKLREIYTDLTIPPFSFRIGRQQVVWGETDNFRALDVINPLDLRWHWSRESWEDIRIPVVDGARDLRHRQNRPARGIVRRSGVDSVGLSARQNHDRSAPPVGIFWAGAAAAGERGDH
jgi:hypothetical protein